ncbi:neural cell adhesion molecule 1-like isoform X3 [Crassostrea virginica]
MNFGYYRPILQGFLFLFGMVHMTAGIALTVLPSSNVAVNQTMTLRCELEPNPTLPIVVYFEKRNSISSSPEILCSLEPQSGVCKNSADDCRIRYNASCPSDTLYIIQVKVLQTWNGQSISCRTVYTKSELVVISVKVPVTSVILTSTPSPVITEQQINLTCTTSYSSPPANITWIKSSVDISSQASYRTEENQGLHRTISSLLITVKKEDNRKQVYCIASNTPNVTVTSNVQELDVLYIPEVRTTTQSPYKVREGQTATLSCAVTDANPNTGITWRWSKTDSPNTALDTRASYTIPNIQRERSGKYSCTASNTAGSSVAVTIDIDVQYKPDVKSSTSSPYKIIEGQTATLSCTVTDANPNTGITWRWIKTGFPNTILHTRATYTIPNIQRGRSGSYSCTANNTIGTSEAATVYVDVLYKPDVKSSSSSPYKVREGQTATLSCTVTDANPNTGITWRWIKTDFPNTILHTGASYTILNIQRGRSGSYSCTANNTIGTSEAATIYVDVLYTPSIEERNVLVVNETERVTFTREIFSNPLSDVLWLDGRHLLESETSKTSETSVTTSFIIQNARCTDTKNFTIVASNELQRNVTSQVELIVNCKPMPDINNITLGVSDDTGFTFSTTVIAYPKPSYVVLFENSTNNNGIWDSMTVNTINNFTVHLNKTTVNQADYGIYLLNITNSFGVSTIHVYVVPQRKPNSPRIEKATCNINNAKIEWTSSFNGGVSQTFFALAILDQQKVTRSESVKDRGKNKIHYTELQNLQPSTKYVFYVVAKNKHGNSSSDKIECTTLQETNDQTAVVAGGVGGTLALVILIIIIVFLVHRRYTCICSIGFEKRNSFSDVCNSGK